jgi:hypothetical protein
VFTGSISMEVSDADDGGSKVVKNIVQVLPDYTLHLSRQASYTRRRENPKPLQGTQVSHRYLQTTPRPDITVCASHVATTGPAASVNCFTVNIHLTCNSHYNWNSFITRPPTTRSCLNLTGQ